jgi:hypothetical protein
MVQGWATRRQIKVDFGFVGRFLGNFTGFNLADSPLGARFCPFPEQAPVAK